jgi:hypothetical protein
LRLQSLLTFRDRPCCGGFSAFLSFDGSAKGRASTVRPLVAVRHANADSGMHLGPAVDDRPELALDIRPVDAWRKADGDRSRLIDLRSPSYAAKEVREIGNKLRRDGRSHG